MEAIRLFCRELEQGDPGELKRTPRVGIYANSLEFRGDCAWFMARLNGKKVLVAYRQGELDDPLEGTIEEAGEGRLKICETSAVNAAHLRRLFPFTRPRPLSPNAETPSIGLGDRLGIAAPGQIRAARPYALFPVLAQQTPLELALTDRSRQGVLDDVTWSVFQENFQSGYGADADGLRTSAEVQGALAGGSTMITLSLADHIAKDLGQQPIEQVLNHFQNLPVDVRKAYVNRYLDKTFTLHGPDGRRVTVRIGGAALAQIVTTYHDALQVALGVYRNHLADGRVDFELALDEPLTPTTPEAHWVIASELMRSGVQLFSLAPRLRGDWLPGVDYRGDLQQFDQEFRVHAAIAAAWGYRLSLHGASDKFSLYPTLVREAGQGFHLKTSGTTWLQGLRLVALKEPALFREIGRYCLAHYAQAERNQPIVVNEENIPDLERLGDEELAPLFESDDFRQIAHIAYGLVLGAKDETGAPLFRERLFRLWGREEEAYEGTVAFNLRRHFELLGIPKRPG